MHINQVDTQLMIDLFCIHFQIKMIRGTLNGIYLNTYHRHCVESACQLPLTNNSFAPLSDRA
jgi:hypothetical protein